MSMTLWFTQVTAEELNRAIVDPRWARECLLDDDRPCCYLGKAWAGIQFLLDAAGADVDIYQDATCVIANGDDGLSIVGWNDDMVAHVARTLSALPFEALAGHYDPEKLSEEEVYPNGRFWDDDEHKFLRDGYEALVTFVEATATSGGAAIRSFNF
ncbi:DUF1877 family protein [Micromonospora sp. CA-269861]|uniref:DUF1877 family protein n=1 Tax=Micromonospora sp. CA-269861 TaxID=3239968 RepID=UPI003D8C36AE